MKVSIKTVPWTLLALLVAGLSAGGQTQAQQAASPAAPQLYSHGDPTAQEQYLLEQLNRARSNPAAEGQRIAALLRTPAFASTVSFYALNPDAVAVQIAAFPATPPLAFNAQLLAAARAHSTDLAPHDGVGPGGAANPLNDHNGYDGSTPESRVAAAGYTGGDYIEAVGFAGENYDPGADTLDTVHAGYLVDWGNPGLGHLKQSFSASREVGMGIAAKPVGLHSPFPLVETEDYGTPGLSFDALRNEFVAADVPALLVGVVYTDADGNGQYDPGEGLAGVTVAMDGGSRYAVTGASGGYALPLVNADSSFRDGTATVRLSGGALDGERAAGVTVPQIAYVTPIKHLAASYRGNVKLDVAVTPLAPPADGSTLLALSGGIVSRAAGGKTAITVRRAARDLSQPLTVAYKQKGTAVAGADYKPLPGSVTFPAGSDRAAFKVKALKGGAADGPATLTLRLIKAPGAAVQAGESRTTIVINP